MRILMTTDTLGGVWTYSLDLASALMDRGVHVTLATLGRRMNDTQRQAAAELGLTTHEGDYRLEWMNDPWQHIEQAGTWLMQIHQQVSPDVVHLNHYAHTTLPWTVPVVQVAHSCVTSWWQAVKGCDPDADWQRYRQCVSDALRCADVVIAPTEAMRQMLIRCYGPLPHSRVIYNGRNGSHLRPGDKQPLVLSAGRFWDEAKNLVTLDAAACDLAWPVYVAGETDSDHPAHPRPRYVRRLGQLSFEQLGRWLSCAAVYALPARYEPFGLSAVEAALAGCCLVLGDVPTLREIWGDAAVFVPPDDARALKAGIEQVMLNDARRQWLASRARQRALELTAQRMAGAYHDLYCQMLSQPPRRRLDQTAISTATLHREP